MGLVLNIVRTLVDQAGTEVIGRVTASPVANTVLDRLKTVGDLLTNRLPAALVGGRLDVNVGAGTVDITDGGGSITVDGPLTDTELRATAVPVSDGAGSLTVDASSWPLPTGAATEATLATLATEAKLETVRVLLASLDGKDYATETTLVALNSKDFATETKLEAVRVLLASIDSKDFATETKLETVRVLLASIDGKDFATETTLTELNTRIGDETTPATGTVNKHLEDLVAKDFATETTLDSIKDTDGIKKITDPILLGNTDGLSVALSTDGTNSLSVETGLTSTLECILTELKLLNIMVAELTETELEPGDIE